MKSITIKYIAVFLLFFTAKIGAQNLNWAKSYGGSLEDVGSSISLDNFGNVYTTGSFRGTVDFDPGSGTAILNSLGDYDIFVQKMDASGNFQWAKSFGSTGGDLGYSSTVDASGNIITTGRFFGTVDFNPGAGISNLTAIGSVDIFIQKMDALGNFLWAKNFGGNFVDEGYSITTDLLGNVYTTGSFELMADADPSAGIFQLTAVGAHDIFIQKLDATGNFLWAKSFGGNSYDAGGPLLLDDVGNVYCAGYFEGSADFDPGSGTTILTSVGLRDIFLQKLDSAGNFVWVKSFGGLSYDGCTSICKDNTGNIYLTGAFGLTVDFDPGVGVNYISSLGSYDAFIQKFDTAGNYLWTKSFGGNMSDGCSSITIDTQGNIYTTGGFEGTADFDPGSGSTNYTSAGSRDVFIQKLDSVGNFLWVTTFGGSSFDEGLSIKTDLFNVYITGYFRATVDFDPGIGTNNHTSSGLLDIFNLKLSQTPTSINGEISKSIKISAYPNPTTNEVQITFEEPIYDVELVLCDATGAVIFKQTYSQLSSTNIELKGESNLYILTINTSEGRITKILVKG